MNRWKKYVYSSGMKLVDDGCCVNHHPACRKADVTRVEPAPARYLGRSPPASAARTAAVRRR
jgi:hypothetical protein